MRKRAIRSIIEHVLFDLIVSGIVSFIVSFPIMLALGALHSQWPQIPAFGWWGTYLIVGAWLLIMSTYRVAFSDDRKTIRLR